MTTATIARTSFLETSVHHLTAEISELAHGGHLPRRALPARIIIPGCGNDQPFIATKIERNEGDLLFVEYHQSLGCVKLTIFND